MPKEIFVIDILLLLWIIIFLAKIFIQGFNSGLKLKGILKANLTWIVFDLVFGYFLITTLISNLLK